MVTISRTLTLADYRSSNELMLRNGTWQHRLNFWLFLRVFPALGVPLGVWAVYKEFLALQHGNTTNAFVIVFACSLAMTLQPWALRNRIKKMHRAQGLDRTWTIEVSDEGIHSIVEGLSDARLNWNYFDNMVEDSRLFLFLNTRRPAFIGFPKADLTKEQLEQLRSFGRLHIASSQR